MPKWIPTTRFYSLTRDELRYILDPKEVYGEDFPGEAFRVLKEKEIRLYGEYRTRRLVSYFPLPSTRGLRQMAFSGRKTGGGHSFS